MHTCPNCGQACYCNGDIEDHDTGDEFACDHWLECESDDLFDDETVAIPLNGPASNTAAPAGVVSSDQLGTDPKCDRCCAPITTGAMAMMRPHGRRCALVDSDDHWETIEELRIDFGIERVNLP